MRTTRNSNLRPSAIKLLILAATLGGISMQPEALAADAGEKTMTIVRIFTGADNQSHFEDVRIPLKSTGKIGFISELTKATGIVFRETGGDYNYEFHTAPRRQYDPSHPLADAEGYVTLSNVNPVEEMVNMLSASRSYQNNAEVLNTTKSLITKTLQLGS